MAEVTEVMPDLDTEEVVVSSEEEGEGTPTEAQVEGAEEESTEEVVVEDEAKASPEADDLRKENQQLKQELLKISSALASKIGKPEDKPKEEAKEEKLTRQQLKQVIEQYKDDPEVMLRVMEHISTETAQEIKNKTVEEERARNWHGNMQQVSDKVLRQELAKLPETQAKEYVEKASEAAENLGLSNHPVGLLAAYAILQLAQQGDAEASKATEAKRVESIKKTKGLDKSRETPGSTTGKTGKLSKEEMEVVKNLGIKPESYLKYRGV